jgi:alanine racemase
LSRPVAGLGRVYVANALRPISPAARVLIPTRLWGHLHSAGQPLPIRKSRSDKESRPSFLRRSADVTTVTAKEGSDQVVIPELVTPEAEAHDVWGAQGTDSDVLAPESTGPGVVAPDIAAPEVTARDVPIAQPAEPRVLPQVPVHVDPAGPVELETGGILTIDLAAIGKNWKALAQRVVPADCAAVVKADAYGCGIEPVASYLSGMGCTTFFVAHLGEARRVRAAAPESVIYVLNGLPPGTASLFADINARPVIGGMLEFAEWDAFRTSSGWRGTAALQFDTGMNRLGLPIEQAPTFTTRMKAPDHGISLIMSHLACADTPSHALNAKQLAAFRELRFQFRGIATSLANSSGIFLGPGTHCDLVRPGAALYGVNPTPATRNLMEPVVGIKGRIVQVREVQRGDTVGYGATWTAAKTSRIAIVSVGYGDGYMRAAGAPKSGTQAIIANRRCPIVGRVSMDLVAFDVTGLPDEVVARGTYATLIGDGITVDELAARSGTIAYEVLTSLGRRYRRVWTG